MPQILCKIRKIFSGRQKLGKRWLVPLISTVFNFNPTSATYWVQAVALELEVPSFPIHLVQPESRTWTLLKKPENRFGSTATQDFLLAIFFRTRNSIRRIAGSRILAATNFAVACSHPTKAPSNSCTSGNKRNKLPHIKLCLHDSTELFTGWGAVPEPGGFSSTGSMLQTHHI